MDGRSYREQTQYDLLGNTCRKYGFGLFVQYGYSGRAGCGLNGVGGGGNTTSTQSAHQTASLYVPGVLTLYNGHDVRGNMVDAGGARFYEYSVLNQATSIWRDNINNPSIRSRFAYGSDGQRYRRIDDGSTAGGTTTTTYIGSVERRQLPGGSIQWRRSVAGVVLIEHYGDTLSGGITQASGNGTTRHQFNDHLGSVQVIGSISGSSITVLERLDTDAHGEWRTPSPPFGQAGSSHTSRGFTGHEHLNGLDTLHMNGRLYWASGGRMVQPDPIITDPLNPQNWSPYSYVMNNPLNLIDPSGYSFLSKYWRTIVAVVVTVYTGGMAASATSGWAAAGWAAGGGFVAGAIQTDSLRGGVYGAFSGLVFNGIGRAYGNMAQANAAAGTRTLGSTGLTAGQFTGVIIANGAAGGVMSSLQGGKFGHGFASAGFTTGASPMIGQAGGSMAQGTAAALVGGTASVMTGGKFANGAVSGAFSKAYGDFQRRRDVARSSVGGREIPGDIKKGVDAANKANERLQELKVLSMTAEDPRELLNPWRNATLAISEELNVEISSKLYESMGRYFLAPAFSSGSPNWVNADLGPSIAGANLAGFFHTHPGGTSLLSGNDTHVGQDMLGRTISPVIYVGAVGSLSPPVIWNTLTRSQEYVP